MGTSTTCHQEYTGFPSSSSQHLHTLHLQHGTQGAITECHQDDTGSLLS